MSDTFFPAGLNRNGGPSWARIWFWAFLVATPLAWSSVAFVYFGMLAAGKPLTIPASLLAGLPEWYSWAAFTPVVFSLGWRIRLERRQWLRAGLFHLITGTLVALANLALVTAINRHFGPTVSYAGPYFWDVFLKIILRYFHYTFIIYWVIVLAGHAAQFYLSTRQRELEATQLQADLGAAQLAALRLQLQPHFLFNTLHTIAGLVRDGRAQAATATIARLGDLLRQTLGSQQRNEVPLREELRFVEAYLEIERTRFSDQLVVGFAIERDTLDVPVPSMSLQPLVENAIRHGIAREPGVGRLDVRARRDRRSLRIEVRNDGPACTDGVKLTAGVGLANTRARLSRLYGTDGRLMLQPDGASGTLAVLEVPWRGAEEARV